MRAVRLTMEWADDIKIETPEQIEVSLEVAGLGSRFVAKCIDWLVKWVAFLLVAAVGAVAASLLSLAVRSLSMYVLALLIVLFYLFLLGYDIYFEVRRNGQTPGKQFAGIRVIREGGAPLDFQASCVRNLLGMADFLPAFYLLGGVIAMIS